MILILEEPKNIKFKIFNMSPGPMSLKLEFKESQDSHIKILSIEDGTDALGLINPNQCKEFVLRMFATKCGLMQISGLIIRDL
jgi:hypothetical protein